LIVKCNLNYWVTRGSSKSVKHGSTKSHSVTCVSKASSKNDDTSDDEVELAQNDGIGNENELGNEEDEVAVINSEKL
jgi:hypothetical protein